MKSTLFIMKSMLLSAGSLKQKSAFDLNPGYREPKKNGKEGKKYVGPSNANNANHTNITNSLVFYVVHRDMYHRCTVYRVEAD